MAYREIRRIGGYVRRSRESLGKGDGDELLKSALASGCDGASSTGLDTKLLTTPGSLGEIVLVGIAFGFSFACSLRAAI